MEQNKIEPHILIVNNSMEKEITIDGEVFQHVKTRSHVPVSVYKGNGCFLRIGPPDLIQKEQDLHKRLTGFDFPIPKIIKEGAFEGRSYFVETSLGDKLIGDVFLEDIAHLGHISDEHFQEFLVITEKFALAQLKTIRYEGWWDEFYKGSYTDALIQELPHLKGRIEDAVEKAKRTLISLPAVMTHNDFNPYNLFKDGVIDMEFAFYAPAGLDLVSNIFITSFFPEEGDFEYKRTIKFSKEQIQAYLAQFDALYRSSDIPEVTKHIEEFLFFRAIHATVGMHAFPKLQQWRYERLAEIVDAYVNGQSIKGFWGL